MQDTECEFPVGSRWQYWEVVKEESAMKGTNNKRIARYCRCTLCDKEDLVYETQLRRGILSCKGCAGLARTLQHNPVGHRYKNWETVETVTWEIDNFKVKIRCRCGYEKIVPYSSNHKNYDGCPDCNRTKYTQSAGNAYWGRIIARAKKKGFDIDVDWEYAWELMHRQGFRCALSGIPINIDIKPGSEMPEGKCSRSFTASLDRIDSSLGYIAGNIQWVHKTINLMKNVLDQADFIYWCKLVADHNPDEDFEPDSDDHFAIELPDDFDPQPF